MEDRALNIDSAPGLRPAFRIIPTKRVAKLIELPSAMLQEPTPGCVSVLNTQHCHVTDAIGQQIAAPTSEDTRLPGGVP